MTDSRSSQDKGNPARTGRIGYIRLDPGDTDILRQALMLDGIGGFSRIHVERPADSNAAVAEVRPWEKRTRMLSALEPGDVIFAASADRLCSGARDLVSVFRQIQSAGASLVLLEEGVDTRTPSGRSAFRLAESIAKAEYDSASRGRREGIQRARVNGRRIGRPPVAVPANFRDICREWSDGLTSGKKAASLAGMRSTSFYARAAELGFTAPPRKKQKKASPIAIDESQA